jgi:NAD(P)-dependent dehydrogenase (short-subunit alcohol dehydrogenase family)
MITWESSLADWQWVLGVNLWGVIHGIHFFVSRMLEQGDEGHIVNTASAAGLISGSGPVKPEPIDPCARGNGPDSSCRLPKRQSVSTSEKAHD